MNPLVVGLAVASSLLPACSTSSGCADLDQALALLKSGDSTARYDAVIQLGARPPSDARRDALAGAVRDREPKVRLMAAIVIVGDGTTAPTSPPSVPEAAPVSPSRTPNPPKSLLPLSPTARLVVADPWFAGTLHSGALAATQDGNRRVRALGQRAAKQMQEDEATDSRAPR